MFHINLSWKMMGTHHYPDYTFLDMEHMHEFGFIVHIPETSERNIEFIEFKKQLMDKFFNLFEKGRFDYVGTRQNLPNYWDSPMWSKFGARSCEDLAVILGNEIMKILPDLTGGVQILVKENDQDCGIVYTEEAEKLVSNYNNLPDERRISEG